MSLCWRNLKTLRTSHAAVGPCVRVRAAARGRPGWCSCWWSSLEVVAVGVGPCRWLLPLPSHPPNPPHPFRPSVLDLSRRLLTPHAHPREAEIGAPQISRGARGASRRRGERPSRSRAMRRRPLLSSHDFKIFEAPVERSLHPSEQSGRVRANQGPCRSPPEDQEGQTRVTRQRVGPA
jgi:hypothetical protein